MVAPRPMEYSFKGESGKTSRYIDVPNNFAVSTSISMVTVIFPELYYRPFTEAGNSNRKDCLVSHCFIFYFTGNVAVTSMDFGLFIVEPDYEAMKSDAFDTQYGGTKQVSLLLMLRTK